MKLTEEALRLLLDAAKAQNEAAERVHSWDATAQTTASGNRPGDYLNARGAWPDWLNKWGWKPCGGKYWKRPGKDAPGISATVGYCKGRAGNPLLYVFSSNASPFEQETAYSLFSAFALVEHHGDFREAAQALPGLGYGEKAERYRFVYGPPPRPESTNGAPPDDRDATAADLIEQKATIRWVWEKWIPLGVLTILASEPGIGKTRLCADLARRVFHGLAWPDGAPASCPHKSTVLWVAADNQHPELGTLPGQFSFPPTALYLNAPRADPFGGTMLDSLEDLKAFCDRIERVKPALVFIDTSLNATDRSAHKPEDAKAFFVPLMRIAQRTQTAVVCVTHTNAAGKPLGRRITGQGRVVMQLEWPDREGQPFRRKLWVSKSNSVTPPALGVTMGDHGNEYDTNPPEAVAEATGRPNKVPARLAECCEWLSAQLPEGTRAARVSELRTRAEEKGFSTTTLYAAKARLGLQEEVVMNKKWWKRPQEQEPE